MPYATNPADGVRTWYEDDGGAGPPVLRRRVGDVVAVLDALRIDRMHFDGFSWGDRPGFAVGEHAPDRLRSLVLVLDFFARA